MELSKENSVKTAIELDDKLSEKSASSDAKIVYKRDDKDGNYYKDEVIPTILEFG